MKNNNLAKVLAETRQADCVTGDTTGWTAREIQKQLGMSKTAARQRICDAVERGAMVFAGRRLQKRIDGYMARVPVYALAKKGKGKGRE